MQEVITPAQQFPFEVVVQYDKEQGPMGIGLRPRQDRPSLHFVDAIYGDKETVALIGTIFRERMKTERNLDIHAGYGAANAESVLDAQLGRYILDAVTGSTVSDGMWTYIDRSGGNRLVRILRKARDTIYGRDE